MSKYTTELRYIIEEYNESEESDNSNADEFIEKALPKLFNFSYPIYDENYKKTLELNIVRHFYTREICTETVGRWKMFLRDRLWMIMPKYNIMYKELNEISDKLLSNVDMTESQELTNAGKVKSDSTSKTDNTSTNSTNANQESTSSSKNSTSNNGSGDSDAWQTSNDTPQGALTDIESNRYLSSAVHNKNATNQNSSTESDANGNSTSKSSNDSSSASNSNTDSVTNQESQTTESYVKKLIGKQGGNEYITIYQKLVDGYLNIDNMICDELEDLFFQLW